MSQSPEPITALEYTATAVITPDEDGLYVVSFPAFPDLAIYGETLDEPRAMAADCLRCYLEGARKDGTELPDSERPEAIRTGVTLRPA